MRLTRSLRPVVIASAAPLAALLAGCGDATPPPPSAGPTYHRDVAPLVAAHCASCHQAGGIAPFPLAGYEDAKMHAGAIRDTTAARTMPPYGVDASGDCNAFVDARWLSDAEIATLGAWADAGAPEGDPADAPDIEPSPPQHLEDATHEIDMGVDYTPDAAVDDDYRCFVLDPGVGADSYLTAYEVIPGEPRSVHHVLLFSLHAPEADAEAELHDAEEAGPGYTCFGGPRTSNFRFLAAWAPGTPVTRYPEGTGLPIQAGRKVVLQVHYNLAAGALPDRTRIAMHLEPQVPRAAEVLPIAHLEMQLPPGMASVTTGVELTVEPDNEVTLLGVYPHMHKLGRTLRVERERAGATSCVVDVPAWDFHWQQFYFYAEPITAQAGDLFRLTCGYDTRGRTTDTLWGEGTDDEMCLAGFYFTR